MAAGQLAKPGNHKHGGPCLAQCKHVDCDTIRIMAASPCKRCGKPIGYDTRFYDARDAEQRKSQRTDVGFVHASCEEDAADLAALNRP